VFRYPNREAAVVALNTVRNWLSEPENSGAMDRIVFNVFLDKDLVIYNELAPQVFT
jgi:hypothetical protein